MTAPVMNAANYPFGLRDVKIYPFLDAAGTIMSTTGFDLPAAQTFSFADTEDFTDLRGDDDLLASKGAGATVNWTLEAGGVALQIWAIFTGGQIIESGVAPNRVITLRKCSDDSRPYFQVRGLAMAENGGDNVGIVYRAKCNGDIGGQFGEGQFFITSADGIGMAIPGTKLLYDFVQHESKTFLSTVAEALPIVPPKNVLAQPLSATTAVVVWEPVSGYTAYRVQTSANGGSTWVTQGPSNVNEVQTLAVTGTLTAGTWSLTYDGQQTTNLAFGATNSQIQTALEAIVGSGNVTVTGTSPTFTVTFTGALAGRNVSQLVVNQGTLVGGSIAATTGTQGVSQDPQVPQLSLTGLVTNTAYLVRVAGKVGTDVGYYSTPVAFRTF